MKKIYAILGSAAVCASATAAAPSVIDGRVNLKDLVSVQAKKDKSIEIQSFSNQKVIPLRAQAPQKASVEKKTVVLYEDFNNVPDGTTETIGNLGERYADYIASHYYEPGRYINNDYTPESGTWEGDFVMAGKGGTVVLQCYNPQMAAGINTPMGDYSGDITVTIRARATRIFYGANNELGYSTSGGSDLTLSAYIHGYDSYDYAKTDMGYYSMMSSGQIYENEGWQEITFKFRNENANADGYLNLSTRGSIEIDWIKITDDNTYLPCPTVNSATNFTNDGFTINWDPVRRSYNYYIDLWKQVYTADSGLDETFDFETETLPEWLSAPQAEYAEGEGVDGTNAFAIVADGEGNGIAMADMGAKLGLFSTNVKFLMDDMETREDALYLLYDVLGENGWEPLGYLACDGWWTSPGYYYEVELSGPMFEGMYKAVRVYAYGTTEDSKIFVDNISVWSERPYVLERVKGDYGDYYDRDNDDYSYNYYTYTGLSMDPNSGKSGDTHYTFVGLEPETEYWYRVRSHNVKEFSIGDKIHAFGVAAPELSGATNVAAGSFTANWKDAPKAQKYYVTNYSTEKITKDDPEFSLMLETFGNCDGEADIALMQPIKDSSSLDKFTDHKGWTGKNLYYGFNMIGGLDYTGSYLVTPSIMANPERGSLYVYIEAIGYPGDYLYITCLKDGLTGHVSFDEEGYVSGWLEINPVEGEQIKFQSYYGMMFAMTAFEAVQAVKAGDVVRHFDCQVEVPAGVQSYTFSNLGSDLYSYTVVSSFTLEGETVLSDVPGFVNVDMTNGGANISNVAVMPGSVEEARFAVDGNRVNKEYKGVVIVKNSDGSVSKKISK